MRLWGIILTGVACISTSAGASEIGSGNKLRPAWDVHESITRLAEKCIAETKPGDTKPERCSITPRSILAVVEQSGQTKQGFFENGARWPDDPLRMLEKDASRVLFASTMLDSCARAKRNGPAIDQRGLLCASHYGPLQYAHAQDELAYSHTVATRGEQVRSRDKMLQWARFAFRAASDRNFAATTLCKAINDSAFSAIRSSLTLADSTRCSTTYTVATLFSWYCHSLLTTRNCNDRSVHHEYVLQAGTGAILHLIQDSYSQSHVARLPMGVAPAATDTVFPALSACYKVSSFYDYGAQKDAAHNNADKPPLIDSSCTNETREVDDVITASARALWLVQRARAGSADIRALETELVKDLKERVFALRDEAP